MISIASCILLEANIPARVMDRFPNSHSSTYSSGTEWKKPRRWSCQEGHWPQFGSLWDSITCISPIRGGATLAHALTAMLSRQSLFRGGQPPTVRSEFTPALPTVSFKSILFIQLVDFTVSLWECVVFWEGICTETGNVIHTKAMT